MSCSQIPLVVLGGFSSSPLALAAATVPCLWFSFLRVIYLGFGMDLTKILQVQETLHGRCCNGDFVYGGILRRRPRGFCVLPFAGLLLE
jgi:hypothetical protein